MGAPDRYAAGTLARVRAACEADPEREACGFVVERAGAHEVVPVPNVAADARDAYVMDPAAQLRVMSALDAAGGRIVAVWHSHVDAPATLSARDVADALVDGVPTLPGAEYLVVSVIRGRAVETRRWAYRDRGFVELPLP